ncbi:hypothetical protein AURDEDRAFT_158844 [Auricularia subglabra TFB-10046 SS5]|nr:hypothetical protein AURDEDRAFT_158844 [Auricularia subglabra TFB-10046 SS5]
MAHLPSWYHYSAAPIPASDWREYRGVFPPDPAPAPYGPPVHTYRPGPFYIYNERADPGPIHWPVTGYSPPREPARIQVVDDRQMGIHPTLGFIHNPLARQFVAVDMSRPSLNGALTGVEYGARNGRDAAPTELSQEVERMPAFDVGTRKVNILVQFETGSGKWTWATTIETNTTMTVRGFVEALHRKLYEPIGEEVLTLAARKDAWNRAKDRRLNAHAVPEGDKRKVCRIDMLGSHHVFRGLYRDFGIDSVIEAKYGRDTDDAAIAWVAEFRAS